jgi:hypothetical protein
VILFHQGDGERNLRRVRAQGEIARQARAVDAAAQDENVEGLAPQPAEKPLAAVRF